MGEWYKVRVHRKSAAFTVNLGTTFDIRTKTGMKNWNNPQMVYAYQSIIGKGDGINSSLTLTGSYPNYTFTSDSMMSNSSVINVLAYEGDGNDIQHNDGVGTTWVKMKQFRRSKVVELNESNNFQVDLKAYSDGLQWENVFAIVAIKEANLHPYFRQFDYTLSNLGNSIFKVNPRMFGCEPTNQNYAPNSTFKSKSFSVSNCAELKVMCRGWADGGGTYSIKAGTTTLYSKYISDRNRPTDYVTHKFSQDYTGSITVAFSGGGIMNNVGIISYQKKETTISGLKLHVLFLEVI